jgi:hypothetical protein
MINLSAAALLTGPYGLLVAPQRRAIPPTDDVPFHCSDLTCEEDHRRILSTSNQAGINRAIETVSKLLDRKKDGVSDWSGYFRHFEMSASNPYDDLAADSIAYLIGDALTLDEQRALAARLLDQTNGELRTVATKLGIAPGAADRMVRALNAAELLQLTLMMSNEHIGLALDGLVADGKIKISPGEIRVPVINSFERGVGWYGLQPQLSRYGLRFVSPLTDLALLRLRRLVAQMYRLDDEGDRSELEWQLRHEEAGPLDAKLEQHLRKRSPRQTVSSLLLARKSNFIVASSSLTLAEDTLADDEDRINSVMWKLGFSVEDVLDPHREFWRLQEKMVQVARQSPVSSGAVDDENIRRYVLDYFVKLEALLKDAILFTTWALTNDHFASNRSFVYRPSVDAGASIGLLRQASATQSSSEEHAVVFEDDLTLYPLMRAFQVLASHLRGIEEDRESSLRPREDIPNWARGQSIQEFAFRHTVPFLDLLPESRELITNHLSDVSRRLVAAEANEARNEWFHAKKTSMSAERLRVSLEAIRDAVTYIEDAGFARQVYRRVRMETDEAGRTTVALADAGGREVLFHRPTRFAWLDMPTFTGLQHVMIAARFAEPAEVLRFRSEAESPYSEMWRDYPKRLPSASSDINIRRRARRYG